MASIKGLWSHNFRSTEREELISVMGTKTFAYRSGSWLTGATLTNDKDAYMASLIDRVFLVNDTDKMVEYNGTYWTFSENSIDGLISKFIISGESRMFLFNIQIQKNNPVRYSTRVWYSNPPLRNTIQWGFEEGSDLVTTADSAVVTSASSLFVNRGIKVGDTFFITTGSDERDKEYIVQSIDSQTQITLTESLSATATGIEFWVGSNWFDVGSDDGDVGNGIGIASNEIVFVKKNSVHRYNVSGEELRRIKDVPGTTSSRSVISWGSYCWWYHPSGIYRTGGGIGEKVSNSVEDIIEGVADANQDDVVGFVDQTRNEVGWYLGDVTLRDGDTISKCAVVLNLDTKTWEPRSYDKNIKVATNWLRSSIPEVYFGDDNSGVFQLNTGTTFDGSDIPFSTELFPLFPSGEDALNILNRVRAYIDNGPDVQVFYKLIYKPRYGVEGVWDSDTEWKPLKGSQIAERVDWYFDPDSRASGVKLKFVESGGDETFLIKKFTLYFSEPGNF